MASLNRVFVIGNLTRDPEVRYIPSGKAVSDLRLAINRRYRTSSGEDRDETVFVNATVWGRQAETCSEYLTKGSPVLVEGSLRYEEWEKDGQRFSRHSIMADRVQFLGRPRRAEFGDAADDAPRDRPADGRAPAPPDDAGPAPDGKAGAGSASDGSAGAGSAPDGSGDDDDLPF